MQADRHSIDGPDRLQRGETNDSFRKAEAFGSSRGLLFIFLQVITSDETGLLAGLWLFGLYEEVSVHSRAC